VLAVDSESLNADSVRKGCIVSSRGRVMIIGDKSFYFSLPAFGSACHFIFFVVASTVSVISLLMKSLISASFSLKL